MSYRATTPDPRDPNGEHMLAVTYDFTPGAPPIFNDIYGGDPGYGPEYEVTEAFNKRDRCVLSNLTAVQLTALIDDIHSAHEH